MADLDLEHLVYPPDPQGYYRSPFLPIGGQTDSSGRILPGHHEFAIPGGVRDAANALAETLEAPGLAMQGRIPAEALPAVAARSGLELGGLGLGAGLATGASREASLGIFAGRRAAGAPISSLNRAVQSEVLGLHPEDIWNETGWFRDVDGRMKFEIPDSDQAKWIGPVSDGKAHVPAGAKLGDLLDHPRLFEQYPELKDLPVNPASGIARGAMARDNSYMELAADKPQVMVSNALHEINHAVQNFEGFAVGASAFEKVPPEFHGMMREIVALKQQFNDLPLGSEKIRIGRQINGLIDQLKPYSRAYTYSAGEVSSRNVQERFETGQSGHPFSTQGYPHSEEQSIDFRRRLPRIVPQVIPVDHNPFTHRLEPVDHDPFSEAVP